MEKQIKNLAWNTFKRTGNINTFIELLKVKNLKAKELKNVEEIKYGDYKN